MVVDSSVKEFQHCTAFCPKCGADLYFLDGECYCKDKECNWTCGGCNAAKDYYRNNIEKGMSS